MAGSYWHGLRLLVQCLGGQHLIWHARPKFLKLLFAAAMQPCKIMKLLASVGVQHGMDSHLVHIQRIECEQSALADAASTSKVRQLFLTSC